MGGAFLNYLRNIANN